MSDPIKSRKINLGEQYQQEVQDTLKLILLKRGEPPSEICVKTLKIIELHETGLTFGMFKYYGVLHVSWSWILANQLMYLYPLNKN